MKQVLKEATPIVQEMAHVGNNLWRPMAQKNGLKI